MTDAVLVFPPSFRVTDVNGAPVNGAKIKFNEVGPGAAKPVYSDAALSVSLGAVVRTRSDGYPVVSFGSEVTTLIYVGSTAYYIEITDANDVAIFPAKDNIKGAVDTSTFLTSAAQLTLNIPVVALTSNTTLDATHKGKCINANASGGDFTLTLTSAVTLGDGWNVLVRHAGTANRVKMTASQNIAGPFGNTPSFALRPGESVWIQGNGATFVADANGPPFITATIGIIEIVDRVAAEPGAPTAGARYIATGAFTVNSGALSIANHDLIEATGQATWFKVTPPADCGWVAFVQDEDRFYSYKGTAWTDILNAIRFADLLNDNRNYAEYTTYGVLGTVTPFDDTIPQNTEGEEILSAAITPQATTSRVRIRAVVYASPGTGSAAMTIALHKDSVADALDARGYNHSLSGAADAINKIHPMVLEFEHSPATISAVTYKIRAGASSGNIQINGTTARLYGGVQHSTLVVEEIKAA